MVEEICNDSVGPVTEGASKRPVSYVGVMDEFLVDEGVDAI